MGRIAEALKKAEQERRGTAGSSGRIAPPFTPVSPPIVPIEPIIPSTDERTPESPTVVKGISESLVPFYERSSLITEQYRSLRTRLLSQNPHHEHRIVAITSAEPREGKSVTTLNLGCVLSEIRHLKVAVVDGDFRRASLARLLNQPEGPGLAEVLRGQVHYSDVMRPTSIPNLTFIPAGDMCHHSAAELLASAAARPVFQRIQNDFHYALVDTPPATTVTDVGIIGQMCHGVVVLVRLHRTEEAAAKRTVRLLQVNNIPILGCMLIGRDSAAGPYGYGYTTSYYRYYKSVREGKGE